MSENRYHIDIHEDCSWKHRAIFKEVSRWYRVASQWMTKFDISLAYPFMSLSFVLVLILNSFFRRVYDYSKIIGMAFIVAGISIGSRQ